MSNDHALFIIHLPNDPSQTVKPSNGSESSPDQLQSKSLCDQLKIYLSDNKHVDALWILSDDRKTYEVTFSVEFGFASDRTLQELSKLGIGRRHDTKIFVLPTTIIFEERINGEHQSLPILHLDDDLSERSIVNDLTLSKKIRHSISASNFKKSVRARLMVHQVVASIRAANVLSFDFVLLICLASMLAAFGLLENSTVTIVASMLVSPLMNPILGIVFGLSVREHSLWKRGLKNEFIGLIICTSCGFIIGLLTTFAETKWGSSETFPTSEMKSRGDIKRLWVGVLIALPSGAGVALSVLGGNTGSLVGVAISASLLPPAVNCGLLFAYSLLGASFSSIAASSSSINLNNTILNCNKYINNNYEPFYSCNLASESAILACCSLILTIVNIICIIIMALIILRIKEVVPLHQPNQDITNFFHHDVKVARDYNRTLQENDFESTRWKSFRSVHSHDSQHHQETGQSLSSTGETTESRRKLLHLKTFAQEYDLNVFDKTDYDLLTSESQEKVRLLIHDLIDMCQEVPPAFIGLFHLQPGSTSTSTDREHLNFYKEIIELLPPKWYRLFVREQSLSWSKTLNRTYSLHAPDVRSPSINDENDRHTSMHKQFQKTTKIRFHRQCSFPETSTRLSNLTQETNVLPIARTRFHVTQPLEHQ